MATDVKPNLFPVPAPASTPKSAPRSTAPGPSAPADGRKFADELRGQDPATDAQRAAVKHTERAGEAADQLQDGISDKFKQTAEDYLQPKVQAGPTGAITAQAVTPATLDEKAFRLAMREHLQKARSSEPLAFLSGRLESLEPGDIADLVAENPFIAAALSTGDLAGMMRQPVPVETLLSQLEVPKEVIQSIEAVGIDLSKTIAPRDFLRALGVDPNRVSAELTILADALPVDGVQPYVERAARLQGKVLNAKDSVPSSALDANPHVRTKQNPNAAESVEVSPLTVPSAALEKGQTLVPPPVVAAQTSPEVQGVSDTANLGGYAASLTDTTAPAQAVAGGVLPQAIMTEKPLSTPKMQTSAVDPFVEMTQRGIAFVSVDEAVNKPSVQPLRATDSLEEALLQTNWTPGKPLNPEVAEGHRVLPESGPSQKMVTSPAATIVPGATGQADKGITQPMIESTADQVVVDSHWQAPTAGPATKPNESHVARASFAPALATQTVQAPTKLESRIPIEELQLDTSQWNRDAVESVDYESGSFSGGEGQRHASSHSDASPFSFERIGRAADLRVGESMFTTALSHDAAAGPTPGERADAVQQIMDKALLMTRAGGGSMSLDLSGLSLGQLEMAISVTGNRVDLKILAESDNVRDVLAGDMSILRDAMSAQNMTLTSVDVGVDKRDGGQQSFAGSQQFDQQAEQQARQFENEFSDFMTGLSRKAREAPVAAGLRGRMPIVPPRAYEQGQLAVRV